MIIDVMNTIILEDVKELKRQNRVLADRADMWWEISKGCAARCKLLQEKIKMGYPALDAECSKEMPWYRGLKYFSKWANVWECEK